MPLLPRGEHDDVAAGGANSDLFHAVESGAFFEGDGVAGEALQGVGEVVYFDEE